MRTMAMKETSGKTLPMKTAREHMFPRKLLSSLNEDVWQGVSVSAERKSTVGRDRFRTCFFPVLIRPETKNMAKFVMVGLLC